MLIPLIQGQESQAKVELMLKHTKVTSVEIVSALSKHLVQGMTEQTACQYHNVPIQNFRRALKTLNEANTIHEKLKDLESIK